MMTHRERFHRVFNFEPVDRIPLYYFGTWRETKQRWIYEGYTGPYALELCHPEPFDYGVKQAMEYLSALE